MLDLLHTGLLKFQKNQGGAINLAHWFTTSFVLNLLSSAGRGATSLHALRFDHSISRVVLSSTLGKLHALTMPIFSKNHAWKPITHSHHPTHDTRIYSSSHIGCASGYPNVPRVDDSLSFCFHPDSRLSSRVITYEFEDDEEDLRLELWSPNSTRRPFFPGRRRAGPLLYPPTPFCDGHLGPFDPTRSPQYFDPASPHFAFILRSDDGTFPVEAEECVPIWAVWESAPRPRKDGRIQPAYWKSLSERASQLRKRADTLTHKTECREWQGFIEAYPIHPEARDLDSLSNDLLFEDAVALVAHIQRQVAYLAAWVRMGDALLEFSPNMGNSVAEAVCPRANDILMGLWVNGMSEHMISWMAAAGVPIFVVHEIQGTADSPARDESSIFVTIPLEGSDLATSVVLDKWNGLLNDSPGMSVDGPWDTGVDVAAATPRDKLLRWRSFSRATKLNFPGEDWSSTHMQPLSPASSRERKDRQRAEPDYIKPPPVQSAPESGIWNNFVESTNDGGQLVFYFVGKNNKQEYEDAPFVYYDRTKKRVLHCDGRLVIPSGLAHDSTIFGFPCPDASFFTNRRLETKMPGSSWLYPDKDPLSRDIGRIPSPPSTERMAPIQVPTPAQTIQVEHSTSPASIHEDTGTPAAQLPDPAPCPSTSTTQSSANDPGLQWVHPSRLPLLQTTTSIVPLSHTSEPPPGRRYHGTDGPQSVCQVSRKRKSNAEHQHRPGPIPSRIPGQPPLRNIDTSTPYVLAAGIGHHSMADFRGWMARSVPMLQVTVIRKIHSVVGTAVFMIKFREREEAASFLNKYHMKIIGPDRLALSFARHSDYMAIPRTFLLAEWNIGRDPCLDPVGSTPTPTPPSLLSRLEVPLEDRMVDEAVPEDQEDLRPPMTPTWPEVEEGKKRTRRGGARRRFAQALLGTPSGK